MDEFGMMDLIEEGIILIDEEAEKAKIKRIFTFKVAGLLTNNKGLVIETDDGSEFQIRVIKSK
jgi:hypothetical protein